MTVSTITNKVSYIGNGISKNFAIPFPFLAQEHLKVYQLLNDVRTERTDWTLSGGNMVFETAPSENAQIVIIREVPLTQETDYRENEILAAETLERNFDTLTMQVQQLKEQAERAVTVDIFDDTDTESLIPSIRQSVSDAAEYAETATLQAQNAAQSAVLSAQNATLATQKAQECIDTLAGKADLSLTASKTVKGLTQWADTSISETRPAVVIEFFQDGTSWYRKWSDGWLEQGGVVPRGAVTNDVYVNYPHTFINAPKDIRVSLLNNANGGTSTPYLAVAIRNLTAAHFSCYRNTDVDRSWYACGY